MIIFGGQKGEAVFRGNLASSFEGELYSQPLQGSADGEFIKAPIVGAPPTSWYSNFESCVVERNFAGGYVDFHCSHDRDTTPAITRYPRIVFGGPTLLPIGTGKTSIPLVEGRKVLMRAHYKVLSMDGTHESASYLIERRLDGAYVAQAYSKANVAGIEYKEVNAYTQPDALANEVFSQIGVNLPVSGGVTVATYRVFYVSAMVYKV